VVKRWTGVKANFGAAGGFGEKGHPNGSEVVGHGAEHATAFEVELGSAVDLEELFP
jgi:hypothetical protein